MKRTLAYPRPLCRRQVGEVISRFERKGFKLVALKMQTATRGLAEEHYKELSAKPFFKDLVDYIISGPVICMVGRRAACPCTSPLLRRFAGCSAQSRLAGRFS